MNTNEDLMPFIDSQFPGSYLALFDPTVAIPIIQSPYLESFDA